MLAFAGYGEGKESVVESKQDTAYRTQLPGYHQAWRVQNGNHARTHSYARKNRLVLRDKLIIIYIM